MRNWSAIIVLFVLCAVDTMAQNPLYKKDANYPFILISKDTVKALPAFSDKEFYEMSTGVVFQVNRSEIRPDDPFLEVYKKAILPYINNSHLQLRKVFVRGAASPEGSYENNKRLGQERTKALLAELQKNLQHQYLKLETETSSVTEDYGHLCILMEAAGDADYVVVKEIFDQCGGDEKLCKQRLMKVRGGQLWQRLKTAYFPQLRSASLVLWFSEPDEVHAPVSIFKTFGRLTSIAPEVEEGPRYIGLKPIALPAPVEEPRRHLLAVRTNLVHDFFYMPQYGWAPSPNVQLEYYPKGGHYTYNVAMTWGNHRRWDSQQFFQVRDFQLELRRYFKEAGEFTGVYLGGYVHGDKYGIGLNKRKKNWQGEGGGAGLTAGYVLPLTKKGNFRLEFMVAAGYYMTKFDPYVYGNPVTGVEDGEYYYDYLGSASDFKKRNHRFNWLGPTNFGIQLTYDILYHKRQAGKKGGNR